MRTEYVIQIFLNMQFHRHGHICGDTREPVSFFNNKWVEERIELFERTTLKSLRAQTFRDFRIWILCSEKNLDITKTYSWPKDVEVMHDNSQKAVSELKTDYLSIMRLDSDDLMHREAMAAVRDNQINSNKRECLIFRNCWEWDRVNSYIHEWIRLAPPFFTHIFPRKIYSNWKLYTAQHFLQHGQAGGRLEETRELPAKLICVVKHWHNHRWIRHPNARIKHNNKDLQKARLDGGIFDKEKIADILEDFAVSQEEILEVINDR